MEMNQVLPYDSKSVGYRCLKNSLRQLTQQQFNTITYRRKERDIMEYIVCESVYINDKKLILIIPFDVY
jgi:hypothetical protein